MKNRPRPPGLWIGTLLKNCKMTQVELAQRMGRPVEQINRLINGKIGLTAETALQLEKVLDISADWWMDRESEYRLAIARKAKR